MKGTKNFSAMLPWLADPARGTELCKRALYHTIVGPLPENCPDGCSTTTTEDGAIWILDHIRGTAHPYVPHASAPSSLNGTHAPSTTPSTMFGASVQLPEDEQHPLVKQNTACAQIDLIETKCSESVAAEESTGHRHITPLPPGPGNISSSADKLLADNTKLQKEVERREVELQQLPNKLRLLPGTVRPHGIHLSAVGESLADGVSDADAGEQSASLRSSPPSPPPHAAAARRSSHTSSSPSTPCNRGNTSRSRSGMKSTRSCSTVPSSQSRGGSRRRPRFDECVAVGKASDQQHPLPSTKAMTLGESPITAPSQDPTNFYEDLEPTVDEQPLPKLTRSAVPTPVPAVAATRATPPALPITVKALPVLSDTSRGSTPSEHPAGANAPQPPPHGKEDVASAPISLPTNIVSGFSNSLLYCHICRIFFPPHEVNMQQHLRRNIHTQAYARLCRETASMRANETVMNRLAELPLDCLHPVNRAQFGKTLQDMPNFIIPRSVATVQNQADERNLGNSFFVSGLDVVVPTCIVCCVPVTTQNYKVHESTPSHRQKMKSEGLSRSRP